MIWDIETRKKVITQSLSTPTCLAFSPDGQLVVVAHTRSLLTPYLLTIYRVATGKRLKNFKREEEKEDVVM